MELSGGLQVAAGVYSTGLLSALAMDGWRHPAALPHTYPNCSLAALWLQVPEEKNKDGQWVPKGSKPVLQLSHQPVRRRLPVHSWRSCNSSSIFLGQQYVCIGLPANCDHQHSTGAHM